MQDQQHDFIKYLKREDILSDRIAELVDMELEKSDEPLGKIITRFGLLSEEKLVAQLSRYCNLSVAKATDFPKQKLEMSGIEDKFFIWLKVVAVSETKQMVKLATANPLDDFAKKTINYLTGKKVEYVVSLERDVEGYYEQ